MERLVEGNRSPKSFKDKLGVGDLKESRRNLRLPSRLRLIFSGYPHYVILFIDQGYDISDYYAIDPIFERWKIRDRFEGKKRGISSLQTRCQPLPSSRMVQKL